MPELKEYTNKIEGLRPTETGVDATASAARRIGSNYAEAAGALQSVAASMKDTGARFGRGADEAVKTAKDFAQNREISHGAVAYAGLTDKLTQQWNETAKNADPNDPTVAAKFRAEVLEPELEKYRDSFWTKGGQKYGEARVEQLRTHMFDKTAADMGTLAAAAVTQNVRQMSNTLSNTAMSDPSSVPHSLEAVDASVKSIIESSPNIKGVTAQKASIEISQKMRESIVKAGAIGAIQKSGNPEKTAEEWGKRYPEYISGDELKMLSGNARQQIRADRQDRAYSDHLQKIEKTDRSDAVASDLLKKLYSDDPKVAATVTAKGIINDDRMTLARREHMVSVLNREMKPETDAKISAQTSVQIMRQMRDPNADPQKIRDAIFDARIKDPGTPGSITKADMADLDKQLVDRKTPEGMALAADRGEFFKKYAPTIDPSMGDVSSMQFGRHSALGMQKMYEAEKAARRMEADLRAKGQDPHSLYDPASPNFFGNPSTISKFRATMQDSVNYQAEISKADRKAEAPDFKPPASWQYSESRKQYRDPATMKVYTPDGKEVK